MRIADRTVTAAVLANINSITQQLTTVQEQLASGHRVNQPSDDPNATAALLNISDELATDTQAQQTAGTAITRLNAADSALASVTDVLQSANQLGIQAQDGSLSASDRSTIASELNQLVLQVVQDGNTSTAGQYLFAGSKTTTAPFTAVGASPASVTYNGDDTPITLDMQPGESVRVDVPGDQALSSTFSAIISLRDAVSAGDTNATATALTAVSSALDTVSATRASIGERVNQATSAQTEASNTATALQTRQASLGNTDVASAAVQLSTDQNAYQATLAAAAKILQTSLLDYLK